MKVYFAGGLGEHGRNCFYVEGKQLSFLVDCGMMQGDTQPYPRLMPGQIAAASYLFLTHSHKDHIGAFAWLLENGFRGKVITSRETAAYLPKMQEGPALLEDMGKPCAEIPLSDAFSFSWGRSGHCFGAVWFVFSFEGKRLAFTGDYCENSKYFACDKLRGVTADLAVADCAYGNSNLSVNALRLAFQKKIAAYLEKGMPLLLPVPKNGRGIELMWRLPQCVKGIPYADAALCAAWKAANAKAFWKNRYVVPYPEQPPMIPWMKEHTVGPMQMILISDAQLMYAESLALAQAVRAAGGRVILSGHCDSGSGAAMLLAQEKAEQLCYPVHQGIAEIRRLERYNTFTQMIKVHSAEFAPMPGIEV